MVVERGLHFYFTAFGVVVNHVAEIWAAFVVWIVQGFYLLLFLDSRRLVGNFNGRSYDLGLGAVDIGFCRGVIQGELLLEHDPCVWEFLTCWAIGTHKSTLRVLAL